MKRYLIIFFWLLSISVNATIYYCSPTGSDASADATNIATPWKSWHYAFNNITAGDTCYFMGGTYTTMYSTSVGVQLRTNTKDGTYEHPTCFFAYPDDWIVGSYPVLDCQSLSSATGVRYGVEIARANYLYIKGLTIINVNQSADAASARGWQIYDQFSESNKCGTIKLENCVAHHIGGCGFYFSGYDSLFVLNCDVYRCCDTLTAYDPGGWGSGMSIGGYDHSYAYIYGCRAWKCSDQGYTGSSSGGYVEFSHCWSINNGFFDIPDNGLSDGQGTGFKWGTATAKNAAILMRYHHNNIAVDNEYGGFTINDGEGDPEIRAHLYNNFAYRNGYTHPSGTRFGSGFSDYNFNAYPIGTTADTVGVWDHWYRNNLSYNNWGFSTPSKTYPGDDMRWTRVLDGNTVTVINEETNVWDATGTTVSDADFVSLDTTGLTGARQADGSLPVTTFGTLAATSELINAGTDVGLPYNASPDIGWAESDYEEEPPATAPLVSTTLVSDITSRRAIGSGVVTSDGGDAIAERGVCWSTSTNPTTADSKATAAGTTGSFTTTITGLSSNTTYHVKAYATNSIDTSYGLEEDFTTRAWVPGKSGSAYVFSGGHIIKIE